MDNCKVCGISFENINKYFHHDVDDFVCKGCFDEIQNNEKNTTIRLEVEKTVRNNRIEKKLREEAVQRWIAQFYDKLNNLTNDSFIRIEKIKIFKVTNKTYKILRGNKIIYRNINKYDLIKFLNIA